jgi:uncharacterized protein with PCYCGC motif
MKKPRNVPRTKAVSKGRVWTRPPFWLGVVSVFFGAIILAWGMYFEKQAKQVSEDTEFAPWDSSWPELPSASSFPGHPLEFIRAAYAFAARRPDVVQYLPCYCGCEKQGHQSLQFCFVKKRTASDIAQWDGMGFT